MSLYNYISVIGGLAFFLFGMTVLSSELNRKWCTDFTYLFLIDGNQSAARLAEIVGSSPRTVQRALKRLMDDGQIEHVGSNQFGHYVIK